MTHPWPVERETVRIGRTTRYPSAGPPQGRRDTIARFSLRDKDGKVVRRAIRKEPA